MNTLPMTILIADDDDGHATLVEKNLQRAGVGNKLIRFHDGAEVLDFLGCAYEGVESANKVKTSAAIKEVVGTPAPLLLLLDVKMPKLDGVQVLSYLRADQRYSTIPIVVLTTTDDPREIEKCYRLGCNVYMTKPVTYDAFVEAVKRFGLFLEYVRLPIYNPLPTDGAAHYLYPLKA